MNKITAKEAIFRRLVELLCNYECNGPYDKDEKPPDMWPWAKIESCLAMEHCGDCIKAPCSCPRCFVEDVCAKALWVVEEFFGED